MLIMMCVLVQHGDIVHLWQGESGHTLTQIHIITKQMMQKFIRHLTRDEAILCHRITEAVINRDSVARSQPSSSRAGGRDSKKKLCKCDGVSKCNKSLRGPYVIVPLVTRNHFSWLGEVTAWQGDTPSSP